MFYLGHLSPQELKNNQRNTVLAFVKYIAFAFAHTKLKSHVVDKKFKIYTKSVHKSFGQLK